MNTIAKKFILETSLLKAFILQSLFLKCLVLKRLVLKCFKLEKPVLKSFLISVLFSFGAQQAFAEEASRYSESARERQYLGGVDESDLKVQQKLTTASKMAPVENIESNEGF